MTMFTRSSTRAGLFLLGFAALTVPAAAQQPSQAQIGAIRSACRADFMAHCSGVAPGTRDALACLQKNIAALSAGCQKAVSAVGGAALEPPAAATTTAAAPAPAATASPSTS